MKHRYYETSSHKELSLKKTGDLIRTVEQNYIVLLSNKEKQMTKQSQEDTKEPYKNFR